MDLHEGQYFDAFQKGKFSFIHLGPNKRRTTTKNILILSEDSTNN